jgi:hypothetical protein
MVVAVVVVVAGAAVDVGTVVGVASEVDGEEDVEVRRAAVVRTAPDCAPHAAVPKPAASRARKRRREIAVISSS